MTIKMPSAKLVSVDRRAAEFISRAGVDQSLPVEDEAPAKKNGRQHAPGH
jgi:hypothetical protein